MINKAIISLKRRVRRKCLKKFIRYFPGGYQDTKYIEWERAYKWNAHLEWKEKLNKQVFRQLLDDQKYNEIAKRAVSLESKTNLLFSFEKMALRDAVKTPLSAKLFAEGLYDIIYGTGPLQKRFNAYRDVIANLPVKQTRVLTWPVLTIFGFLADPYSHIYLKPTVTRAQQENIGLIFIIQVNPHGILINPYYCLLNKYGKTPWRTGHAT